MHRVEQGMFKHESYTLAYEVHGPADGTPVLLLHAILLDGGVNRDFARPMADAGFRVILLDLLGHGRSDRAEAAELRTDFFAEQVIACMDHLQIDQSVVGGVSLGAIVALQVAVTAPKRVCALLLEMPVMEEATPFAAILLAPLVFATNYLAPLLRPFARLLQHLPRVGNSALESALNAAAQDPEASRAILHGVLVGPVVPPRRLRRKIDAPALVIGHRGDWLHNLEDARALVEELSKGRLLLASSIVELRLKPDRLMPEILAFLREATSEAVARLEPATSNDPSGKGALVARFEAAAARLAADPADGEMKPSNEMKLKLYALYRQARTGDVQGDRPDLMNLVGRLKYDAWAELKGTSPEEAMRRYAELVESIERKFAGADRKQA